METLYNLIVNVFSKEKNLNLQRQARKKRWKKWKTRYSNEIVKSVTPYVLSECQVKLIRKGYTQVCKLINGQTKTIKGDL